MDTSEHDIIIVGGGLAGGLAALALLARPRRPRVALVEGAATLGGNHTWSFHAGDLPQAARAWVLPLVAHWWPGQTVMFPDGQRTLETPYASITSHRFAEIVGARMTAAGGDIRLGDAVVELGPGSVRTASGRVLRAPVVLDARGPAREAGAPRRDRGYQKFLGLEVELDSTAVFHGGRAILMDATVAQHDGFRFVYVLPFGARRLLVEDTYYAAGPTGPAIDRAALRDRIAAYLAARGHRIARVVREEVGALPLPWSRLGPAPSGSPFAIGHRGGWYHPLTGYSFPVAVRVALALAGADGPRAVSRNLRRLWRAHARQARFFQLLARLLFTAVAPAERWRLVARLYRLPEATIARFYALDLTLGDRLRLLAGRPPRAFSLRSALFAKEVP